MQNDSERLTIGKAAKFLGVSIDTLRRWEKKGFVLAHRSPGGHRHFLKNELTQLFEKKYARQIPTPVKKEPVREAPPPIKEEREENVVSNPKKGPALRSWLIVLFVIFLALDLILVAVYFSLSQKPLSPLP